MTNEEAKAFLDNLKICIDEHPIVADWLVEIADRKTENSSEKPNNCEDLQDWKDRMWAEAIVTEPTTEDCSTVDKDINARSKDEPQYDFGEYADRLWKIAYERGKREALEQTEPSCDTCKLKDTTEWCKRQEVCRAYQPKDEPQIFICPIQNNYEALIEDEPQTETEIAKAIVHKMIDDAVIAEDAYPGLRQRMHEAVERLDEYYPSEDERSE